MKSDKLDNKNEPHPLFPSGEWEGFYTYTMGPSAGRFEMQFSLDFRDNMVMGGGSDSVGAFRWQGSYSINPSKVNMTKRYFGKHQVVYDGHADENGIWGTWHLEPFGKGGFHIWPKDKGEQEENKEEEVIKNTVKIEKKI